MKRTRQGPGGGGSSRGHRQPRHHHQAEDDNNNSSYYSTQLWTTGGHQQQQQQQHKHNNDATTTYYSTRLCFRNLPKEVTEKDVKDFVVSGSTKDYHVGTGENENDSTKIQVTDCRVLKGRRMAFVGVTTSSQCDYLIRKFNKSYFRTCKLVVERAYKQQQQQQGQQGGDTSSKTTTASISASATTEHRNEKDSKKDDKAKIERELKKKEEFLAVMGVADINDDIDNNIDGSGKKKDPNSNNAAAGRKFWANDDVDVVAGTTTAVITTTSTAGAKNDDNGNDQQESTSSSSTTSDSDDSSTSDDDDDDADPLVHDDDSKTKNAGAASSSSAVGSKIILSDMDFLRSKQVETDDLVVDDNDDDGQVKPSGITGEKEEESDSSSSNSDSDSDSDSSDEPTPEHRNKQERVEPASESHQEAEMQEHGDDGTTGTAAAVHTTTTTSTDGRRIFVRNLPFSATEDEIMALFSNEYDLGVEGCYVPVDDLKRPKGFGFVTFATSHDARKALEVADGCDFQGRLLHLLPAAPAPNDDGTTEQQDGTNGKGHHNLSYRERQEKTRREQAMRQTTGWSASYVRGDAVVDTLAERLGLRKGDILAVRDGLSSGDAAVRLALGETAIIEENRKYFAEHGIDMEALVSVQRKEESGGGKGGKGGKALERSKKSILVKNLPADTKEEELLKVFGSVGGESPSKILLPPSRTISVVEYSHGNDAARAFKRLAYRRFKSVPLYLEWAPLAARVDDPTQQSSSEVTKKQTDANDTAMDESVDLIVSSGPTPTIMIKNLNFKTSEDQLRQFFSKHVSDIRAVRIPQKTVPIKRVRTGSVQHGDGGVRTLSMGYGFAEFSSQESAKKVLRTLQGSIIDGHTLQLMPSNKTQGSSSKTQPQPSSGKNPAKLLVRNVPFQASRSELLKLFGSFGQLRKVRLPKKFDGAHRGFAFVEYLTGKEAAEAMKSLSRTHLYGRHLVIEWASADADEDLNKLREKAQRNVTSGPAALPAQNKKIRFE